MAENSPPSTTQYLWGIFVQCPFTAYSRPDLAVRRMLFVADAIWIPLSLLLYLGVSYFALWTTSGPGDSHGTPPTLVSQLVWVMAALSMYVLYLHIFATPSPTKDASVDDYLGMNSIFGRWWFLTRQTMGLQFWHQSISALAVFFEISSLNYQTHAISLWLSGPANFVTVQFFALVAPHPEFKATCQRWKEKNVPFQEAMYIQHVPQLLMAVVDVLFLKDRNLMLKLTPSVSWLTAIFAFFVAYYLSLVAINFLMKGVLPYGIMRDCGSSRKLWILLIAKQLVVLMVLFVPTYIAANIIPSAW